MNSASRYVLNSFRPRGRIGPNKYFLLTLASLFAFGFVYYLTNLVVQGLGGGQSQSTDSITGAIMIPPLIAYFWLGLMLTAKRFHDMDVPGWLAPLVFIPLIPWLILCMWGGTDGPNKYGPQN